MTLATTKQVSLKSLLIKCQNAEGWMHRSTPSSSRVIDSLFLLVLHVAE